jgi:S-adenosylmethionine:tRNA ribosyltransferase-isomerase
MTTVDARTHGRFAFELPSDLEAAEPPEARGFGRGDVRMLVGHVGSGSLVSSSFRRLPEFLEPGDLVVINASGTIPAALDSTGPDGTRIAVHLSTQLDDGRWIVEPRRPAGWSSERWSGPPPPRRLRLGQSAAVTLVEPCASGNRLWLARVDLGSDPVGWLETHGRPIQYGYVRRPWPIDAYQNVFATEPGSAEMPSAGRPFTAEMVTRLVALGVRVAPVVLHTGVSSLEADELPYPERAKVPAPTADLVNLARHEGHRVIAVGTTVVRALETAVGDDGLARPYDGWTDLVVSPTTAPRVTDGMLTGWHEPVSSHLLLLEALTGRELLADSYNAALNLGYRWHEFGDTHLILP